MYDKYICILGSFFVGFNNSYSILSKNDSKSLLSVLGGSNVDLDFQGSDGSTELSSSNNVVFSLDAKSCIWYNRIFLLNTCMSLHFLILSYRSIVSDLKAFCIRKMELANVGNSSKVVDKLACAT